MSDLSQETTRDTLNFGDIGEVIAKRLHIVFEDNVYEWFELTQFAIESISLDLFRRRIYDFLRVPYVEQAIRDIDGPLLTSLDLRRCLRSTDPMIWIGSSSPDRPWESPEPHPDPTVVVYLCRSPNDFLGFSNVISDSFLVISRIDANGLLFAVAGEKVKPGDIIVSVNQERRVQKMRKELLVSSTVELRILRTA